MGAVVPSRLWSSSFLTFSVFLVKYSSSLRALSRLVLRGLGKSNDAQGIGASLPSTIKTSSASWYSDLGLGIFVIFIIIDSVDIYLLFLTASLFRTREQIVVTSDGGKSYL